MNQKNPGQFQPVRGDRRDVSERIIINVNDWMTDFKENGGGSMLDIIFHY